ncbi:MAG: hypothetical protein RR842_06925 [Gordonibacter sp.]|uniref:hypothetical protein n=1 Tax=Gordonibacter sp. TaxID=1968902 RepID=UPI002FC64697
MPAATKFRLKAVELGFCIAGDAEEGFPGGQAAKIISLNRGQAATSAGQMLGQLVVWCSCGPLVRWSACPRMAFTLPLLRFALICCAAGID